MAQLVQLGPEDSHDLIGVIAFTYQRNTNTEPPAESAAFTIRADLVMPVPEDYPAQVDLGGYHGPIRILFGTERFGRNGTLMPLSLRVQANNPQSPASRATWWRYEVGIDAYELLMGINVSSAVREVLRVMEELELSGTDASTLTEYYAFDDLADFY